MKNNYKEFFVLLKSQRGSIAIMMVISAVVLITPIVVNFTFDTNVAKLKVYNIEQRTKAKLNAESGLKFAMARLRLYKEAYNFLQKNTSLQSSVKQQTLDILWNFPFIYPIPAAASLSKIQRDAIADFHEETFIEGGLQLTINNISNKLNLNMLRVSYLQNLAFKNEGREEPTEEEAQYSVESQLYKLMQQNVDQRLREDDAFNARYSGIEVVELLNELKYYLSDPRSLENVTQASSSFQREELTPKQAPIVSFSEIYTLPSWSDELASIIQDEFTIHGALMVDLNKVTANMLKMLFPDILEEDITEFFKWKDDPDDPKYFNSLDEFRNYIINIGNIVTAEQFDRVFNNFKKQGVQFGPTPTLFKIVSTGTNERTSFTITAYVVMPAQPEPRKKKEDVDENGNPIPPDPNAPEDPHGENNNEQDPVNNGEENPEVKTQLLNPRIVEIIVS